MMRLTSWKPGIDVLGASDGFSSARELRRVIRPYRRSGSSHVVALLQPTDRSVRVTDNAIMKMLAS